MRTPASDPAEKVARLVERGRGAWPELALPSDVFARYLEERTDDDSSSENATDDALIHAEDLFLACACLHGVRGAISAFELRHAQDLDLAIARERLEAHAKRDLRAEVFSNLFTAAGGLRPWLLGYRGRGPLSAWLRVCTTRYARTLYRRQRARPIEERVDELANLLISPSSCAEGRTAFAQDVHAAAEEALASLAPEDKELLAQRYLHEQTVDELARARGVHRVTMARRLARIQYAVRRRVKTVLARRVGGSLAEVDNLWSELTPDLDISVGRILAAPPRTDG